MDVAARETVAAKALARRLHAVQERSGRFQPTTEVKSNSRMQPGSGTLLGLRRRSRGTRACKQ